MSVEQAVGEAHVIIAGTLFAFCLVGIIIYSVAIAISNNRIKRLERDQAWIDQAHQEVRQESQAQIPDSNSNPN